MNLTREQVASRIRDFIDGNGGPWDWDDFISIKLKDPVLDQIRKTCGELPDRYPPKRRDQYCSEEGLTVLRDLLRTLSTPDT